MLSRKSISLYFVFISVLFLIFVLSSCQTISVPGNSFPDKTNDISIIVRPDFDPELVLPFTFVAGIPGLEPPESIVICTRLQSPGEFEENGFVPVTPSIIEKPVKEKKKIEPEKKQEIKPDEKKEIKKDQKKTDGKKNTTVSYDNTNIKKTDDKNVKKNTSTIKDTGNTNEKKTAVKTKKAESRISEIYSHRGEDIEISFNNNGWIFAGYGKEEDAKAIKYVSKDSSYASSCFTFRTMKAGTFDLDFLLQDHTAGTEQKELVRVYVLDENSQLPSGAVPNTGDDLSLAGKKAAEAFLAQGNYEKALEEYLKGYDYRSWEDNENIAAIYEKLGKDELAAAFWGKNLEADEAAAAVKAAEKLLDISKKRSDLAKINYYLDFLLKNNISPSVHDIVSIAESMNRIGATEDVLAFVNKYTPLCRERDSFDKLYFFLGRLYETDSNVRDLKKSKFYYEKILSDYPASAFCRQSEARLNYLDRHFFRIQ